MKASIDTVKLKIEIGAANSIKVVISVFSMKNSRSKLCKKIRLHFNLLLNRKLGLKLSAKLVVTPGIGLVSCGQKWERLANSKVLFYVLRNDCG